MSIEISISINNQDHLDFFFLVHLDLGSSLDGDESIPLNFAEMHFNVKRSSSNQREHGYMATINFNTK